MEVSNWSDGTYFALDEQIAYTKEHKSMTQGELINGL